MRSGTANLPLHAGHCPPWLFERMQRLGAAVLEWIVLEYGPQEVLRRLADPFWFQALGCAVGFDWHSSGLTTTLCGALKEGLRGRERELGVYICGGKGKTSRRTPGEIAAYAERDALPGAADLAYASRMAAKVDNTALQDGYQLYHHTFIFSRGGQWAVVQQGMHEGKKQARRYHWLGEGVQDFVCEPHAAVCCDSAGKPLNMVARESEAARRAVAELSRETPDRLLRELRCLRADARELTMPAGHAVPQAERLRRTLALAFGRQPENFAQLLEIQGVGPQTVRALALLAEVACGAPPSYRDPVRYSFAHGGKDGHPYPVNREEYDRSIDVLRRALTAARAGRTEKLQALRRLAGLAEAADRPAGGLPSA